MIQFTQISEDLGINLALVVQWEVVPDEDPDAEFENYLELTTILGNPLRYYGPDADMVLERIRLLCLETQSASIRMTAALDAAEQQLKGATPQ